MLQLLAQLPDLVSFGWQASYIVHTADVPPCVAFVGRPLASICDEAIC